MHTTMAHGTGRATRAVLALAVAAATMAAPAPPDDGEAADRGEALQPAAAALRFRLGAKRVNGAEAAERLPPTVRALLNAWADPFDALELEVVVSEQAEIVVAGTAKEKQLREVMEWMEQTWALLDPVVPVAPRHEPRALLALVFDAKGMHSEAWTGTLEALGEQGLLVEDGVAHLARNPGGLLMRFAPLFLQPTVDMAGDATQGDDEFRLPNEVANKTAQCLVSQRVGPVPPNILWGLGFLAEQRLFGTSYMFDVTGFVSASDHFDWPRRAERLLDVLGEASLADMAADDSAAGRAEPAQVLTWAVLDHLHHHDPEAVAVLLSDLAALQRRTDSLGLSSEYQGSRRATLQALQEAFAEVTPDALAKDLRKRW